MSRFKQLFLIVLVISLFSMGCSQIENPVEVLDINNSGDSLSTNSIDTREISLSILNATMNGNFIFTMEYSNCEVELITVYFNNEVSEILANNIVIPSQKINFTVASANVQDNIINTLTFELVIDGHIVYIACQIEIINSTINTNQASWTISESVLCQPTSLDGAIKNGEWSAIANNTPGEIDDQPVQ